MVGGTCFFIGHHDAGAELLPVMKDAIERHITEYGVVEFCVGYYGNFDRMATRLLTEAKVNHPEISIQLLTPYHPFERPQDVPDGLMVLSIRQGWNPHPDNMQSPKPIDT